VTTTGTGKAIKTRGSSLDFCLGLVCPQGRAGGVQTEGVHQLGIIGSDFEKRIVAETPLGRLGQPDDIARVAVFLASG
jgi:NAD(P)-dependent dehydrogenase (short-subunit alcohol dehydrogenase family)